MDAVDCFAADAKRFQHWARDGTDEGAAAARAALVQITRLYLAALELPPSHSHASAPEPKPNRVSDEEWRGIFKRCARLPLDMYGEAFDPTIVPPEEPVIGSLADDIADIYREVVDGLAAYERGDPSRATWEWSFGFRIHWGAHATGAIRALHEWLSANAPDRLSSGE